MFTCDEFETAPLLFYSDRQDPVMSRMALLFVYDTALHHEETIRSVLTDKTTRSHRLCNSKHFPGAVLNLPAWKAGNRGVEHDSGIQVSKKQTISSRLTRKDLILLGAFVAER